ncbi:MAG TPA: hypothetical protein VMU84_01965, partial [Thermoanaerobaculia bacterium]|nr:hypothetical protein [Thermoanaerobaculia bacterium]
TGYGTAADYGTKVEAEMRNLPVPEEPHATPAQFVPQCTNHESFTDNEATYNVRVDGLTFYDVVANWWLGTQPQKAIAHFTGPGKAPGCP